jgi:hypothetical protein
MQRDFRVLRHLAFVDFVQTPTTTTDWRKPEVAEEFTTNMGTVAHALFDTCSNLETLRMVASGNRFTAVACFYVRRECDSVEKVEVDGKWIESTRNLFGKFKEYVAQH